VSTASLSDRLRNRIKREGPITFREWMGAALYDPQEGYYCRRDRQRWGRQGDYRTAPERSVLFAATFAHYFKSLYQKLNSPSSWAIVEAGAGAGDFAAAVLETFKRENPQILTATRYIIDELSGASRSLVATRLAPFEDQVKFESIEEMGVIDNGIIFTNELLDAFPVHRVTVMGGQLAEFYVRLDDNGAFAWSLGSPSTPRLVEYFAELGLALVEDQVAEVNLAARDWMARAAEILQAGYLITADYGAEAAELYQSSRRREGTLRAFERHQSEPHLLGRPGNLDLTSTIDWTTIRRAAEYVGFETIEFERQDRFLLQAGLLEVLELLVEQTKDEAERVRLRAEAREMILPDGMAASFQVLIQKRIG